MNYQGFPGGTVPFLADLSANNDKDWFDENRERYEENVLQAAKDFVNAVGERIDEIGPDLHAEAKVNGSIFRINRDTRFSKNKTPYKDHLDMMFWAGDGRSRDCAALFFRLTPTGLHLGSGKHGFPKDELARYREAVAGEPGEALTGIITDVESAGFTIGGSHYKRVPKGYDNDHPRAELLKHNALSAMHELDHPASLNDEEIVPFVIERFAACAPLMYWVREHVIGN